MGLEEEFDLQIPDEDAEKNQTVEQAVTYIDGKLVGKDIGSDYSLRSAIESITCNLKSKI